MDGLTRPEMNLKEANTHRYSTGSSVQLHIKMHLATAPSPGLSTSSLVMSVVVGLFAQKETKQSGILCGHGSQALNRPQ